MPPLVSKEQAIISSIHAYVAEQSSYAVGFVDPKLPAMAARLIEDLRAFGLEIVPVNRAPGPDSILHELGDLPRGDA